MLGVVMKKIELAEIKKCEVDLLKKFSQYCDENNLCYVLGGGTLLGAIRHKGFIPWDDDIDLMMPRTDYEKFLQLQQENKLFEVRTISDNSSCIPFIKILDSHTIVDSAYVETPNANSLWIDIFPIDGLPSDEKELKKKYRYALILKKSLIVAMTKVVYGTTSVKRISKAVLRFPLKMIGSYRLARWIDRYCKKIKFEDSEFVGGLCWGYGPQECMPRKEWLARVKVEFEGHEFWAPGCWDLYLRSLYGDYMKLPPEEKRVTHNMVAYVKE